ncbi:MAG TPA: hybrid sensor histidine kinase/response regulator [bacterium]|mgnify:CR=1 FL=1|nr:hybrid sensor histidine kinase/response regulator [bacterium]
MQTILVVDDKSENIYLMQSLLQGAGYAVQAADNGTAALAAARQTLPDLVIADILMPVMDGFSLCREWKQDARLTGVPFMFYTATYTDRQDEEFALKQGADLFLAKPAEPEVILAKVKLLLDRAQQRLRPGESAVQPDPVYLKEYNEVLVRKLVDKVEELERRNRELARKEQMKSHFLTVAAHELHTPLTCVFGYAELLKLKDTTGLMAGLCRGVERLIHVTRMIIQMSREEAAELPLQWVPLELNALINDRLAGLRAFVEHRRQELVVTLTEGPLTVAGDQAELGQAFDCLLLNAIRFTPDGGRITVTSATSGGRHTISVADTGIGIPPEEHERIFERFYQLKDAMTHHSGTIEFLSGGLGLGLSIARAIVERHGGSIAVQSRPGAGSVFTMALPRADGTCRR